MKDTVTTYTCDQCGKPITGIYGPLMVTVRSPTEPQVNSDVDFCSYECASQWMALGPPSPMGKQRNA